MIHYSSFCKNPIIFGDLSWDAIISCRFTNHLTWFEKTQSIWYNRTNYVVYRERKCLSMKKIHKFFSKDLLHILGAVGIFVAFLISIAYKQVGIGALIAAWLIAMAIIVVAWITDIRKADLLKNGKIVSGKVNAVKRVHIKFHMSTYHLADEDVIYPWVIRYQYKIGKDTYYGQSHWFWFNPLVSKGTPIKVTIDPQNPERSIVAAWES